MTLTTLRCFSCDAPLNAESLDEGRGLATCPYCGAVTRISRPTDRTQQRPTIALPDGYSVNDDGGDLRISYGWFTWKILFLVPFTVVWCGFLVVWYAGAVGMGAPVLFLIFPLIHVSVGVAMAYACAAFLLNRTKVTVSRGELTVSHGPLPWPGGGTYDAGEVEQFFCQEKIHHGKNGTSTTYTLNAQIRNRGKKKLITGLENADTALFLEQQLESHLKIADVPVAGELPR